MSTESEILSPDAFIHTMEELARQANGDPIREGIAREARHLLARLRAKRGRPLTRLRFHPHMTLMAAHRCAVNAGYKGIRTAFTEEGQLVVTAYDSGTLLP